MEQNTSNTNNSPIINKLANKKLAMTIRVVGITLLAFILSLFLASPISFSVSSIFSSPEKNDTRISDFFAQVANKRPVRVLDPEIVIVDIGSAGRQEIASLLEVIGLCDPKAVGLDVMFEDERDGDEPLLQALSSVPNLILPLGVEVDSEGHAVPVESSYFQNSFPHGEGVVNLASGFAGGTIREFVTWFVTEKGDSIPSFPVAIASAANPHAIKTLRERGARHEYIDYPSHEFEVIPISEAEERAEELLQKIVLIGAMKDADDIHATPLTSWQAGILIHAHALSTILSGRYYSEPGIWADWGLAFVLCLFTVWFSLWMDARVKGLVMRLLQLLMVYLIVQIGYYLYVDNRIVINFTYTLLMISFGLFASDIWHGAEGLFKIVKTKINH